MGFRASMNIDERYCHVIKLKIFLHMLWSGGGRQSPLIRAALVQRALVKASRRHFEAQSCSIHVTRSLLERAN